MLGVLAYERPRARFENTGRGYLQFHVLYVNPRVEFYLGVAALAEMASWPIKNNPGWVQRRLSFS